MTEKPSEYSIRSVESRIVSIRGQKVILDADLAVLYVVSVKRLNEQVKRNRDRFPADFAFQLNSKEHDFLRSQFATLKPGQGKHRKYLPWAFTEHGTIMAATVLNSPQAVQMSVFIVRAFVKMRERLATNQALEKRLAEIEKKLLLHDASVRDIYERIRPLLLSTPEKPKRRIGYTAEEKRAVYRA